MKKKFLGLLIALGGSVAAVGTAFALYTGTLPADKSIQIGTKTTGDVALAASVVDADSTHAQLTPESVSRTIVLDAGFTTNDGSVYIQDYYLAKLEFKISSASTGLIDALKEHTWIELGTQSGENAYGSYWGWTWEDAEHHTGTRSGTTAQNHLNSSQKVVADDNKSVTWSTHYPLFKGANVSQFLFHISMEGISDEAYLAIAEATYNVDFTVSEPDSDFEMAYIVGDATGGWEDKDEFRMTVNAKASGYEWMFKTGSVEGKSKLANGKEYKLHVGTTYCCDDPNHVWDEANDGKTFYWNGSEADHGDLFN